MLTCKESPASGYSPAEKWIAAQKQSPSVQNTHKIVRFWQKLGALALRSRFIEESLKSQELFAAPLLLKMHHLEWLLLEIPEIESQGIQVLVPKSWDPSLKKPRKIESGLVFGKSSTGSGSLGGVGQFSLKAALGGGRELPPEEVDQLMQTAAEFVWMDGGWVRFSSAQMRKTIGVWQGLRDRYGEDVRMSDALRVIAKHQIRSSSKAIANGTRDLNFMNGLGGFNDPDEFFLEYCSDAGFLLPEDGSVINQSLGAQAQEQGSHDDSLSKFTFNSVEATLRKSLLDFLSQHQKVYTLHPYQVDGCLWMLSRHARGLGVILADDMGLGKTLQTIVVVNYLIQQDQVNSEENGVESRLNPRLNPRNYLVLIVAPTSLLYNWSREFYKFAPELRCVVAHRGYGFEFEDSQKFSGCQVVITSYGTLHRQIDFFAHYSWAVLAADEAQNLKNPSTQIYQSISTLNADFRLALSGTPIENSVKDVFALVDFVLGSESIGDGGGNPNEAVQMRGGSNPHTTGSPQQHLNEQGNVDRLADSNLSSDQSDYREQVEKIRKVLQPILLRRMKTDPKIGLCLPEKSEKKYMIQLPRYELLLYQSLVNRFRQELKILSQDQSEPEERVEAKRRGVVLSTLIRLRQICSEPRMVLSSLDLTRLGDQTAEVVHAISAASLNEKAAQGKFYELIQIFEAASERGEKIVVFSQFMATLDMVSQLLENRGATCFRIDGGVTPADRARAVENFEQGSGSLVMLLSLKAGGVGLNLTSANHVVHFDRWWNPAVEDQASDRVYRIGQRRNVVVHYLVYRGTIDEGMDRLLESKRSLADDILKPSLASGEVALSRLSDGEILELLEPSGDFPENVLPNLGSMDIRKNGANLSDLEPKREST